MTSRALRAIDISLSGVRWVEVTAGPQGAELRRWGILASGNPESAGAGSPSLPDAASLAALFGSGEARSRKAKTGVLVSLPSSLSTARSLRLPSTGREQIRTAVEYEVREALEIEGDGLYWDFLSVSDDGAPGKGTRVLAVATLAARLRPYLERLREAGLEVRQVVPQGLAAFWALQAVPGTAATDFVLLLDVGQAESVLVLGNRREVLGFRSVPAGSRSSPDAFWHEIGRTLEFFRHRFPEAMPTVLYISGDREPPGVGQCAELAGLGGVHRFHPGDSLEPFDVCGDLHHEDLSRFAAPLGLVAAELAGVERINLLPPLRKGALASWVHPRRWMAEMRHFLPAVVLLVLILLTWAGGPHLVASARKARLERAGEVAVKIEGLNREMALIKRVGAGRIAWSQIFLGLSDTTPSDINITEVSFNQDGEVRIMGNFQGNLAKLADFIGKLEEKKVLRETRIERSETKDRKLDFVLRAKKGEGTPTAQEHEGTEAVKGREPEGRTGLGEGTSGVSAPEAPPVPAGMKPGGPAAGTPDAGTASSPSAETQTGAKARETRGTRERGRRRSTL